MELSPDTKRTMKRVSRVVGYGAAVALCVLGAFTVGWGLRELTLKEDLTAEITRTTTAFQGTVTELYNRIDDRDGQLRNQNDVILSLMASFKLLAEKTENTVEKVDAAVTQGNAARKACGPLPPEPAGATVVQLRGYITEITSLYVKCATSR